MEATLSDHQMLELDESQEGLGVVSKLKCRGEVGKCLQVCGCELGTGACWNINSWGLGALEDHVRWR
jgi:hypothetical protein